MKKYFLPLLLILSLAACRVSLVPNYNDGIVKQIESVAKLSDKLFLQIEESEGALRAYAKYSERYIDVQAELADLLRKEKNRDKSVELVTITNNITEQFVKYKDRHKTEDAGIKNAVLVLQREYMSDHFSILLAAEKSLK